MRIRCDVLPSAKRATHDPVAVIFFKLANKVGSFYERARPGGRGEQQGLVNHELIVLLIIPGRD